MSRLSLFLLGSPYIERDGVLVQVRRRKAVALIAYLAVAGPGAGGRRQGRDTLATLFYPEHDQRQARGRLRRALWSLKVALGEGWAEDKHPLDVGQETVGLNRDADVWLDVAEFRDLLAECRTHGHPQDQTCPPCLPPLAEAAALYRDDFMAGFTLRDSPAFDDWQFFQAQSLRDQLAGALERLADGHGSLGEYEPAIAYARRWVALDPLHEPAHRLLMQLYAWSGQRAAAARQYAECERVLQEELGVSPEEETLQLYQAIQEKRELPPPMERVAPVTAQAPARRHNLPVQLIPFVGRKALLAEVSERLQDPACRLLTLVGPGGSGKTRLALEAATAQLEDYSHGVYFVSLAPLDSPEAVVPTVATALDFSFYTTPAGSTHDRQQPPSPPRQQLLDYLRGKSMLLLMDNYEHLLPPVPLDLPEGGASLVTEILQAAPGVKILTTSRARLNVQGEHLFPVPGMEFPALETQAALAPTDRPRSAKDLAHYSAVLLFLQSARRALPGFELTDDNLADVAEICRLVEGMPLGILLAAAWVRMLTPAEIAAEIHDSLDFLETDLRDLPERQRSMRAVFDHSWRLLNEREREVFKALSIFRGGFTPQAAQRVTGATLRELRALMDKSLLERDSHPDGHYGIHELLRQYAAQKLGTVPAEEEAARDRHCAYYAGFLQQREADLIGWNQKKALAEIEAEIENVRASWNWAVNQGRIEDIGRSLESLAEFYHIRAWFQEGEEAFARAAQSKIANRKSKIILGRVLLQQGRFCDALGLVEKGGGLLQESLAIFRDLGARREMAFALCYLGDVFRSQGKGKPLYSKGLAIFKEIGDRRGSAHALRGLGWVATEQGEYRVAQQLLRESVAIFREFGDQEGTSKSLMALGYVTWVLGEYEAAKQLHEESLALSRDTGNRAGIAHSLEFLAEVFLGLAEYEKAKQLWHEGLAIHKEIGNLRGVVGVLADLSEAAVALGEYEEAARLAQQSLALQKKIHDRFGMAWSLKNLGNAACGLGDLEAARRYLCQALETAMMVRWTPVTLLALVGVGALLEAEGEKERALELLALILHHPLSWRWTKDRATALVADLEAELPPEVVAAAQERGRARDLEATVAELLVELGE